MGAALPRPAPAEPFAASRERSEEIVAFAASTEASEMTESELERELEERVRELKRQLLQDHLDQRQGGAAAEPVRDAAGRERTAVREHERTLVTTFGAVEVSRFGYGGAGLESLHPLDGSYPRTGDRILIACFGRMTRDGDLTYTHDANGNRSTIGYPRKAVTGYAFPRRSGDFSGGRHEKSGGEKR